MFFRLRSMPPSVQLLAFVLLAFVGAFLFAFASASVINLIYGFDLFTDSEVLNDATLEGVGGANRWALALNHLGFFILPALAFPHLMKLSTKEYLLLDQKPRLTHLLLGVGALLLAFPLGNFIIDWNASINLPDSWASLENMMREAEDLAELRFGIMQTGGLDVLFWNILVIGILPALGEEFVFRGVVLKLFTRTTKNVHFAIWLSAFVFSLMHFQFYGFFPRMLYGALFGYFMIWSGTIWVPVIVHFLNNTITLVLNYLVINGDMAETSAELGAHGEWWVILATALPMTGVLWWMSKTSRWKQAEYKFTYY